MAIFLIVLVVLQFCNFVTKCGNRRKNSANIRSKNLGQLLEGEVKSFKIIVTFSCIRVVEFVAEVKQ